MDFCTTCMLGCGAIQDSRGASTIIRPGLRHCLQNLTASRRFATLVLLIAKVAGFTHIQLRKTLRLWWSTPRQVLFCLLFGNVDSNQSFACKVHEPCVGEMHCLQPTASESASQLALDHLESSGSEPYDQCSQSTTQRATTCSTSSPDRSVLSSPVQQYVECTEARAVTEEFWVPSDSPPRCVPASEQPISYWTDRYDKRQLAMANFDSISDFKDPLPLQWSTKQLNLESFKTDSPNSRRIRKSSKRGSPKASHLVTSPRIIHDLQSQIRNLRDELGSLSQRSARTASSDWSVGVVTANHSALASLKANLERMADERREVEKRQESRFLEMERKLAQLTKAQHPL